jgi:hypothetical protein
VFSVDVKRTAATSLYQKATVADDCASEKMKPGEFGPRRVKKEQADGFFLFFIQTAS